MTKQLNLRKTLQTKPIATHRDPSLEDLSRNLSEMVEGIKERRGTAPHTKREATSNFDLNSGQ
jgi:hypothetical protein